MFNRKKKQAVKTGVRRPTIQEVKKNQPRNNYYRPYKKPVDLKPTAKKSEAGEGKKRFSVSMVVNYVIAGAVLGIIVFSTTLSSSPVVQVDSTTFAYRTDDVYQQAAEEVLSDNILQRSKLLFRSSIYEEKMIERFPEIETIDAILPLGGRDLSVKIAVSDPLAIVQNGSETGIVDASGVYVSDETLPSADARLYRIRFATPQEQLALGSRILTSSEVELLKSLSRELAVLPLTSLNGDVLEISEVLFNVPDGQFEVRFSNAGFYVKLSAYADTDQQVGTVKVSLARLDREGTLPGEYLDARVPGRVFVK